MNQNQSTIPHLVLSVLMFVIGLFALLHGQGGTDAQVAAQVANLQTQLSAITAPAEPGVRAGAIASPALGPWYSVGDNEVDGYSCNFDFTGTATSSACSIGPIVATSTFALSPTLTITTEPYASTWKIWRAGFPATETTLLAQNLASVANGVIHATTTAVTLTDGILVPGSYINCRVATTTAVNANFNATGRCSIATRVVSRNQ